MDVTRKPKAIVALVASCAALVITACTSSSGGTPRPSESVTSTDSSSTSPSSPPDPATDPSTPTSSSSHPADPRVAAAVKAYDLFSAAANYVQAHPPKKIGDPLPSRGNFRSYSFDPAQGQLISYVFSLTQDGIEYRGTPPSPRTSVTSAQLNAAPYPSVILTDCPTAPADWTTYYRATGKQTGDKAGQVKPPYLVTVRMIFYKNHWGVYKLSPNATRTCTPP